MKKLSLISLCLLLLAACGHWKVERHDAKAAAQIDARLITGMSREDMLSIFPDAQSMNDVSGNVQYLVFVEDTCFWCKSGAGFKRSSDIYSRVVTFENNFLASIEPAREMKP